MCKHVILQIWSTAMSGSGDGTFNSGQAYSIFFGIYFGVPAGVRARAAHIWLVFVCGVMCARARNGEGVHLP